MSFSPAKILLTPAFLFFSISPLSRLSFFGPSALERFSHFAFFFYSSHCPHLLNILFFSFQLEFPFACRRRLYSPLRT